MNNRSFFVLVVILYQIHLPDCQLLITPVRNLPITQKHQKVFFNTPNVLYNIRR